MEELKLVRRLDNLGRVVIPKQMREALQLKEGIELTLTLNSKKQIIIEQQKEPEFKITQSLDGTMVLINANAEVVAKGEHALQLAKALGLNTNP